MIAISSFQAWANVVLQTIAGELAQELLIVAIFAVSFAAWKLLGQRRKTTRRRAKWETMSDVSTTPPKSPPMAPSAPLHKTPATPKFSAGAGPAGTAGQGGGSLRQRRGVETPQASAQSKTLEKQMLEHMERREFTRALHLYRSLERCGRDVGFSEDLYAAFVQSSVRVGKVDIVEQMIRAMRSHGMLPSLQFWQSTLKIMSSRKHYSACLNMYSQFGRWIPTDKVLFSCLINAALEVGDPQAAASMLDKYEASGLQPKDYVLHFRAYQVLRDIDLAEATFRRLGAQSTTLILNLLLLLCVNEKQPERALALLDEGHVLERDRPEDDKLVDVVSYNTVIKGFSQASSPQRCFECLQQMVSKGIEPDDITLSTLLDACIVDSRLDATGTVADMLIAGPHQLESGVCMLFIKGLVRANCLQKAMELYNELKRRRGVRPDIITYSVLIKALVEQRDLARAMKLVEDMKAHGDEPDDIIMTHLLEGCRHAHDHELGQRLFEDMRRRGVTPSEFTLVGMLKLHGRCGKHAEGYEMVRDWEKLHGTKPSVIHYTCLMSGCIRTKSFDDAWAAYELMRASNVRPDSTTLTIMLPGMVAAQRWEAVVELARQAALSGKGSVPAEHLNHALEKMQASGAPSPLAELLRQHMQALGVVMTARRAHGGSGATPPSSRSGSAAGRPPPGLDDASSWPSPAHASKRG
eukprot:CAMPEP_0176055742 /NCGR_PEP_ID=MMETSP0120_2-20121206/27754_1 /TAXON_ID=160619 /ORGANISM="Kryptoperidinium foliaceum, Strain CCMP 1326" /LENGTH=693 /DNA_ID=CAMNT_0017389241 /DNA_START=135 /DNA_END=2213 /DNA_ORIENTATION=-